jgi:hypothetical protein
MTRSNYFQYVFYVILGLLLYSTATPAQTPPPVYVVVFTHIEDNTPVGVLGTPESRQNYLVWRDKLISVGNLFLQHNVQWVFEPDWKFLLAALMYEDSSLILNTNNKNLLRYLKEDLHVAIDPHSHEKQGYNYTDVAHLLDSLGVGGSTVIGGHIWDPSLPQFAEWDRFRVPVPGSKFPWALWRGDILMGSGTPNHVNDPQVSGVWRPKDRYHFFEDDSLGNIVCVGQYKSSAHGSYHEFVQNVNELINLYTNGKVATQYMLTASKHLSPSDISAPYSLKAIEDSLLVPLLNLQAMGKVKLTDFTTLVEDWKALFESRAFLYDPNSPTAVESISTLPSKMLLYQNYPNPFNPSTTIRFSLPNRELVTLKVFDVLGREMATLVEGEMSAGNHAVTFVLDNSPSGLYFYKITAGKFSQTRNAIYIK